MTPEIVELMLMTQNVDDMLAPLALSGGHPEMPEMDTVVHMWTTLTKHISE